VNGPTGDTVLKSSLAATALLLLAGCGATEVDIDALEDNIVTEVKEQTGTDVTARCPDQVDWEAGGSFTCEVEAEDGATRQVDVEMLDDDGQVRWNLAPATE
jgi:hypothetical protein